MEMSLIPTLTLPNLTYVFFRSIYPHKNHSMIIHRDKIPLDDYSPSEIRSIKISDGCVCDDFSIPLFYQVPQRLN